MNDDSYGTTTREAMKRSMEYPAGFKPLNRRAPKVFWRKNHILIGSILWSVVFAAVAVELVLIYGVRK